MVRNDWGHNDADSYFTVGNIPHGLERRGKTLLLSFIHAVIWQKYIQVFNDYYVFIIMDDYKTKF